MLEWQVLALPKGIDPAKSPSVYRRIRRVIQSLPSVGILAINPLNVLYNAHFQMTVANRVYDALAERAEMLMNSGPLSHSISCAKLSYDHGPKPQPFHTTFSTL